MPIIPQWRLSALPRFLPGGAVEQVIASCDLTKPHGVRDRAILLLLARLGLRAGDVLMMRLSDIAWDKGMIRVRGKAVERYGCRCRRMRAMRCSTISAEADVADADRIFLRSRAPYRPFRDSSVDLEHRAARTQACRHPYAPSREPISSATRRRRYATRRRHAGRGGNGAPAQSIDMTAHYAKVDMTMLQLIAQPWPGETPC